MARRAPALAIGLAVLFVAIASRGGVTPLLVVVAVASSVPALAWLATVLAQIVADRRTAWRLALAIAGGLLVAGVVARVGEATAPFRIASDRELRYADVHLGRFPCDFLAWEHLSWECSHFDHGVFEEVGLVVSEGIRVGGRRVRMLNVPVGGSGQRRTVKWRHVEIGRVLRLAYAVPDLQRGGIHVDVRIDGAIADAFDVPRQPDRRIHSRRVDTRRWAGRRARLSIEVAPTPGHFGGGTVAIDGSFHD